jgi:hypothetical protein
MSTELFIFLKWGKGVFVIVVEVVRVYLDYSEVMNLMRISINSK